MLQDCFSSGLCGCEHTGTRKLSSCSMELSASGQIPSSLVCITEVFWSCATSVQLVTNRDRECLCAFPRRACPKEENSRGRKVKLLSEGNRSVPKAADVSLGSAGSTLLTPTSSKEAERCRVSLPSCSLALGVLRTDYVPANLCLGSQGQGFGRSSLRCRICSLSAVLPSRSHRGPVEHPLGSTHSFPLPLLPFYCSELLS